MSKQYSQTYKKALIKQYSNGEKISSICAESGVARSTLYKWLQEVKLPVSPNGEKITIREINELRRKVQKYQNMVKILQSVDCTVFSPTKDKLRALESFYGQYEVHTLCEALDVPRGTFYNHILRGKHGETINAKRRDQLRELVNDIFHEYQQIPGSGKIVAILRERGYITTRKLVAELMSELGLQSVSSTSKKNYQKWQKGENKNILQQQFHPDTPNSVWVSDITVFKFRDRYYYICAILDLFARKVIAYRISKKSSTQLVTFTFRQAYSERAPEPGLIFHSDRGSQYTSFSFEKLLQEKQVVQSFSRSGKPQDNAVMESFFSCLKKEELYRYRYSSESEFLKGIERYITFYNEKRPHSSIHYKTPNAAEEAFYHNENG